MIYKKLQADIGDTVRVSDLMSLRYEKIAPDIGPVWHEIPAVEGKGNYEEGSFVEVTPDVWFVFDKGKWRMMNLHEHLEAQRQNKVLFNFEDHSELF